MKKLFCQVLKKIFDFCKRKTNLCNIRKEELRIINEEFRKEELSSIPKSACDYNTINSFNKSNQDNKNKFKLMNLNQECNFEELIKHAQNKGNKNFPIFEREDYHSLIKYK